MRIVDIIKKKQLGQELTTEEINFFVEGYTNGDIADYQASSLLATILLKEMNNREAGDLTTAMVNSGDTVDLTEIEGVKVDKHSTGGVGDTATLVLGPLVAAVGVPVAKMSGRGLGHTGGTLDKLESIPGFKIEIDSDDFIKYVNEDKIAVVGQTGNLVPADKKIYALRDVTATVDSIPLIASSIMSKKIASGADAIVLDVKFGEGAFMKTEEDAKELAKAMIGIGKEVGRRMVAVISSMEQPLGDAIGNALEIQEAIDTLKGNGPKDLEDLSLELGGQMVVLSGKTDSLEEAKDMLREVIKNGAAIEKFKTFVTNQGGDANIVDDPSLLPQAKYQIELPAKSTGVVSKMVADQLGVAALMLGGGRTTKEDEIDYAVGIVLNKKVGDEVKEGESLLTIHSNSENNDEVIAKLYDNIEIGDKAEVPPLISAIITD